MSTIFPLPALVEALLQPPQGLHSDLSLEDAPLKFAKTLESQRAEILLAMSMDVLIEKALPGTPANRIAVLNEIFDTILLTLEAPGAGHSFAPWFSVYQKINNVARKSHIVQLMESWLLHCLPHLGEQRYLRVAMALDALQASVRCYLLQSRVRGNGENMAVQIIAYVRSTSPILPNADQVWSQVQPALSVCLEQWGKLMPVLAANSGVAFIFGFLSHLVAKVELPSYHWERLVLAIDYAVAPLQPKSVRELSNTIEPLLVSVPIFGLLGEWLRRSRALSPSDQQLCQLAALQMVLVQRPQAPLNQQWMQSVDITALHRAGWSAESVERVFAGLVEPMRALFERHELDTLTRCAAQISQWAEAQTMTNNLCEASRQRFTTLAASLIEGVADTNSRQRVVRQVEALARVCIHHWIVSGGDVRTARALLRADIAVHLDITRDLAVWKRNKQLVAGFAQLEVSSRLNAIAVQALHQLAPELEVGISDQLRYPLQWLQPTSTKRETATRPEGIKVLSTRWAVLCRVHGSTAAPYHMNHWFGIWMSGATRAWVQSALARSLDLAMQESAATSNTMASGCEALESGLKAWLHQAHYVSAACNLRLELERVVNDSINFGCARYEDQLKQGLAPSLKRDTKAAWDMGRTESTRAFNQLIALLHSPSKEVCKDFYWWWHLTVGKHIDSLPEAFVRTYLQALSDALYETLAQEEALVIYSLVFNCYQKTFGLRGQSENSDLLLFSPLPLRMPEPSGTSLRVVDALHPLAAHAKTLGACCPEVIADWGVPVVMQAGLYSDEEMLWQSQMPMLFGLSVQSGTQTVHEALQNWGQAGALVLPLGAAALWLGWTERARQTLGQICLGYALIRKADEIVRQARALQPEMVDAFSPAANPAITLGWVIRQTGVGLMSTPASLCALDTTRMVLYVGALNPDLSALHWRKLWLLCEAVVRLSAASECDLALLRWMPQWVMACEQAGKLSPVTSLLFGSSEMVFAETRTEELQWRDAVSGLLATCLIPDSAPLDGQSLIGRVVFNCDAFGGESPASWNARSQALVGMVRENGLQTLAGIAAPRMAHVGTLLHDRNRLLEMPSLSQFHQTSVLLRGIPGSGDQLKSRVIARSMDEREAVLLPEDAFLFGLLRETMPDTAQLLGLRGALKRGLRYKAPDHLERKKFIGRETVPLSAQQSWALGHMPRAVAVAALLGERFAQRAACEVAVYFLSVGTELSIGKLALWLATDAGQGFEDAASAQLAQALLGDCVAGWRLHQARITPPKNQPMGSVFLIQDLGRLYLIGLLTHQIRRTDPLQTLDLLSNRLMPGEWSSAAPQLNQWVQMLTKGEHQQVASPLINAWVQSSTGTKRLAA